MKSAMKIFLFSGALVGLLLLSSGAVYALGGGGSNGDGRTDLLQGNGPTGVNGTRGATGEGTQGDGGVKPSGFSVMSTVVVPEPVTLLLLGAGLIGVARMRRKIKK